MSHYTGGSEDSDSRSSHASGTPAASPLLGDVYADTPSFHSGRTLLFRPAPKTEHFAVSSGRRGTPSEQGTAIASAASVGAKALSPVEDRARSARLGESRDQALLRKKQERDGVSFLDDSSFSRKPAATFSKVEPAASPFAGVPSLSCDTGTPLLSGNPREPILADPSSQAVFPSVDNRVTLLHIRLAEVKP